MTYDGLRTIITIIYLIFNIFILSLIKIKLKKIKFKVVLIISIICFCVLYIFIYTGTPIERKWVKFDTIENAFNYSCPQKQIEKIIEKDNYGIIIYDYDPKSISIAFFKKDNNKWLVTNPNNSKAKIYPMNEPPHAVITTISNDEKTKFIIVSYAKKNNETLEMSITDSYNTEFEYVETIEQNGYITYYYYAVLDNIIGDYYLLINGNEIPVK